MFIDPASPTGQAYIADHLGATYDADDLADFLGDLHRCDECDDVFTDAKDTDYGENNERVCKSCCIEANQSVRFRRAGW